MTINQFIRYADAERINTFYVVFHISFFSSRTGDPDYITYNQQTGELTYSDEFILHLQYWDEMLAEVDDPLVAAG